MKTGLLLFLSLFVVELTCAKTYECSNRRFLTEVVYLSSDSGDWLINDCALVGDEVLVPRFSQDESCRLSNLSRPNTPREISSLTFGKEILQEGRGYIKISLDNSFADYGPQKLTSFLYCN